MAGGKVGGCEILAVKGAIEVADVMVEEGQGGAGWVANACAHAGGMKGVG
jgi:hypothetical protein